ncbi:hypothetical protein D7Z54_22035 [Salibacterium salarium]|uniref:Uncharacterized protein n=1 Tax=Salibacterium salarium TaxID=284579 RepID=A0A3R9P678_9BACI|nr:hypothetical protein [Salibacterium salarium]RSL31191.1 hypothetical protein D7Z54_22035 [Salibacterium salarium]
MVFIIAGFICIIAAIPAVMIGVIGTNIDWSTIGGVTPNDPAMVLPEVLRFSTPEWIATLGLGALAALLCLPWVPSSIDVSMEYLPTVF